MKKKKIKITFTPHPELEGKHALMSPSKYNWTKDDFEGFMRRIDLAFAAQRGTELHELAANLIKHRIKVKDDQTTFGMYVNDAIDFRMMPEVPVKYSDNCFGTIDSVIFRDDLNLLRIHDLKTGTSPANVLQLMIYAALVCLENKVDPTLISFELRIYQNNNYEQWNPEGEEIKLIAEEILKKNSWCVKRFKQEE